MMVVSAANDVRYCVVNKIFPTTTTYIWFSDSLVVVLGDCNFAKVCYVTYVPVYTCTKFGVSSLFHKACPSTDNHGSVYIIAEWHWSPSAATMTCNKQWCVYVLNWLLRPLRSTPPACAPPHLEKNMVVRSSHSHRCHNRAAAGSHCHYKSLPQATCHKSQAGDLCWSVAIHGGYVPRTSLYRRQFFNLYVYNYVTLRIHRESCYSTLSSIDITVCRHCL